MAANRTDATTLLLLEGVYSKKKKKMCSLSRSVLWWLSSSSVSHLEWQFLNQSNPWELNMINERNHVKSLYKPDEGQAELAYVKQARPLIETTPNCITSLTCPPSITLLKQRPNWLTPPLWVASLLLLSRCIHLSADHTLSLFLILSLVNSIIPTH